MGLDLERIRARGDVDVYRALEEAQRRLTEAERERERAIREVERSQRERDVFEQTLAERTQERDEVTQTLAERTQERDEAQAANEQMAKDKKALENESAVLLQRISELTKKLADATAMDRQQALALEIQKLQRRVDERNKDLYGGRSERRKKKGGEKPKKPKKKPNRTGTTPQPKLKQRVQPYLFSEEDLKGGCDECGGDIEPLDDQFKEHERITVVRRVYERLLEKQQKGKCKLCGKSALAPKPESFMPGGRYTEEFAAEIAVSKFLDHLPLNRQVLRMARRGLVVTRQTLWDQLVRLYLLLLPTLIALHARILEAMLVYADETVWRLMRKGSSKKWWVWVLSDGEAVYFQLVPTRGNAAGRQLFQDYAGTVMADDYSVYNSLEKERTKQGGRVQAIDKDGKAITLPTPDYTLASCWVHARRPFHKAARYQDEADEALDLFDALAAVEKEAKAEAQAKVEEERSAGVVDAESHREAHLLESRRRLRNEKSRAIVAELDAWRKKQSFSAREN